MEKRIHFFYQLCFPYPPVAFAGCGNKAAAFWALLLRDSIHRPEHKNRLRHSARGTGGPTLQPCTQGWTMYTIFAVDTKRQRERFYCGGWQVCSAAGRCILHVGSVFPFTCRPSRGWNFMALCYFTHSVLLLITDGQPLVLPESLSSHLRFSFTLIFLFFPPLIPFPTHGWLLSPTPPTSFVERWRQLRKKRRWRQGEGL